MPGFEGHIEAVGALLAEGGNAEEARRVVEEHRAAERQASWSRASLVRRMKPMR